MLGRERLVAFGATTDAARAARFYGDVLGLRVRGEDDFALVLEANATELRLQKVSHFTPQAFTVLGWQVHDLDGTVTTLARRGVALERYDGLGQDERGVWRAPSGARIAWFRDPDGNLLSLAEYPAG